MDAKVKSMIKLIEEDADSFAKRAEMYYKKRPELVKMVEEFYRAYRALAERYDHANGALNQAHQTMTKAFPNQVPSEITEDEAESYANENYPRTHDDLHGEDDGEFVEQTGRRGHNFDVAEEKDLNTQSTENIKKEMQILSEVLARFEDEKETSLIQYKQSLENLFDQELEFSNVQEDFKGFAEQANKAEDEVESLRKTLKALEVEHQKCLKKIKNLEGIISGSQKDVFDLNEKTDKAETEAQSLKLDLEKMESVKATFLDENKESLAKILNLENKLVIVEDKAKNLKKKAEEDETTFQTVQLLHAQTEEQLESLASELKNRSLIVSDLEIRNHILLNEVLKITEEKESLKELNLSSSVSMKDMESEILSLREAKVKLAEDVELQIEERNVLQQEMYCLKEKIIAMEKSYQALSKEKYNLESEKASLVTQLQEATEDLENLSEKSNVTQKIISDAQDEIEGLKLGLKRTEDSCHLLEKEKSDLINQKVILVYQLVITSQRLEKFEKMYRELEEKHFMLEKEKDSTLCEAEKLQLIVKESRLMEEKHITEIEELRGKVLDMKNTRVTLQEENLKLIDEKISLVKDFLELQAKNHTPGEEILELKAPLSNLSLIFNNLFNEKALKIKDLRLTVENLQAISIGLEDKISAMEVRLEKAQLENMELDKLLKKTEDDLNTLTLVNSQLDSEIEYGKDLLHQKETEISEALKNLTGALKSLEDEINTKEKTIELLKEKIGTLEDENGEIGAQLAAYVPAISSLKDCISSLENSTCFFVQLPEKNSEQMKSAIESHVESHQELIIDQKEMDKFSELRELEARVKAVEKTIIETNFKLEAATKQIEELGAKCALNQDKIKPLSANSESENGLLTKDIMLDQISENTEEKLQKKSERTVFRHYLGLRTSDKKKKRAFCGFVQPPTIED